MRGHFPRTFPGGLGSVVSVAEAITFIPVEFDGGFGTLWKSTEERLLNACSLPTMWNSLLTGLAPSFLSLMRDRDGLPP